MADDKGGPAFPVIPPADPRGGSMPSYPFPDQGMHLRDWFAGQALAGQLAFSPSDSFDKAHQPADVARICYQMADAMLAERAKEV